jgi:hypothetical protein
VRGKPDERRSVFAARLEALRAEVASWTDEERERASAALAAELARAGTDPPAAFWDEAPDGAVLDEMETTCRS